MGPNHPSNGLLRLNLRIFYVSIHFSTKLSRYNTVVDQMILSYSRQKNLYQQMLSCRERDLKTNTKQCIDLLINQVFVSFFAPCSPWLLLKPANQKSSSTFFLVSNFLCSFRINLELLKAGDAMSSPAMVSLTELIHTFLLFETGSCCKEILGSFMSEKGD